MIYEPQEDSFLLLKHIKNYAKEKVLDMGTGSGILAIEACKYAEQVLATDIDKNSINYVKKKYKEIKNLKVIYSDLFGKVKGKFDLIIFNPPYLPHDEEEPLDSRRATTGGKEGYEIIEKFFIKAKKYLNKNGKILIVFSSLTNKDKVDFIIRKNKFKFKELEEEKHFFEKLFVYVVYL